MSWSDELEEAATAGRLHKLVRARFERLKRAGRRTRPISQVRPKRKRRFGSSFGLKPAPLFKPMKVTVTPGKGPPTTAAK